MLGKKDTQATLWYITKRKSWKASLSYTRMDVRISKHLDRKITHGGSCWKYEWDSWIPTRSSWRVVPQILEYILENPKLFPGPHNVTQQRTTDGLTVLDPMRYVILLQLEFWNYRQLTLVWKGLCIHLAEALEQGRGVNIKYFGSFTFESKVGSTGNLHNERLFSVKLRPCFIIAPELSTHIHQVKDELSHHIEGSIYQQGIRMSYLNPVPIASGCYLSSDFVRTTIDIIFKAIQDLSFRAYNLNIEFVQLVTVSIINKKLKYKFATDLFAHTKQIEQSWPLKSINGPTNAIRQLSKTVPSISPVHALIHAKTSTRLSVLQRPDSSKLRDIKAKIRQLSESSRDLSNIAH